MVESSGVRAKGAPDVKQSVNRNKPWGDQCLKYFKAEDNCPEFFKTED